MEESEIVNSAGMGFSTKNWSHSQSNLGTRLMLIHSLGMGLGVKQEGALDS